MKIEAINHASLLLENEQGNFIWTDPWVLSPAFESWIQMPHARYRDITRIASIPPEKLVILISHGHDDHLDEFVLASDRFASVDIIIPKLASAGLKSRVQSLSTGSRRIHEVCEESEDINGFQITNFIDPDFTGDDTIFGVFGDETLAIHANDNWHVYGTYLRSGLQELISKCRAANVLYFVQLGIADPYPYTYQPYSDRERAQIVRDRYRSFEAAIHLNLTNLGLDQAFLYANQARIGDHDLLRRSLAPEEARCEILERNSNFRQLLPGMTYQATDPPAKWFGTDDCQSENSISVLQSALASYESRARQYIKQKGLFYPLASFSFKLMDEESDSAITFSANARTWQNILVGRSTLEAIIVGGEGTVRKPRDLNISTLHHALTKWTYRMQARIRSVGLGVYLDQQTN